MARSRPSFPPMRRSVCADRRHVPHGATSSAPGAIPRPGTLLMFGMRLGADPRTVVTTTPRPAKLIRDLVSDPTFVVTRGSSYENRANLAGAFLQQIIKKYEGTRLGRQELNAELLDDVPGALWSRALIEAARPPMGFVMPDLVRVVVAIDPAASSGEDGR